MIMVQAYGGHAILVPESWPTSLLASRLRTAALAMENLAKAEVGGPNPDPDLPPHEPASPPGNPSEPEPSKDDDEEEDPDFPRLTLVDLAEIAERAGHVGQPELAVGLLGVVAKSAEAIAAKLKAKHGIA